MANEYKSLYLKNMIPLIDAVTLDCMMTPAFTMKKQDGTVASLTDKLLEDDQDE